jgi:hypothetical protein
MDGIEKQNYEIRFDIGWNIVDDDVQTEDSTSGSQSNCNDESLRGDYDSQYQGC